MTVPWLSIVGIGDDGLAGISKAARALIDNAEVLIGGQRHLAMIPTDQRERLSWPSPLESLCNTIEQSRGRRVCVLATGDPMWYGIGVTLARRIPVTEMQIIPAPSAFSLACARLGWSLADSETLTLHGRPLSLLNSFLQPDAKLLLLSHDGTTPYNVAKHLRDHGFGSSRMVVLEHLGGNTEQITDSQAANWEQAQVADLNTLAIDCRADPDTPILPRIPGLPDEAFAHDGQLSKREVRAATLAKLQPCPQQLLWDIGTGCGSIAIEWLRSARLSRAIGIEKNTSRIALAAGNAHALGTPQLQLEHAEATEILNRLEAPDAIFIGGGLTADRLFEHCWQALKPGGRLVANAVTLESEALLLAWQQRLGGDLCRIAISHAKSLGAYSGWKPLMPITQYWIRKI